MKTTAEKEASSPADILTNFFDEYEQKKKHNKLPNQLTSVLLAVIVLVCLYQLWPLAKLCYTNFINAIRL